MGPVLGEATWTPTAPRVQVAVRSVCNERCLWAGECGGPSRTQYQLFTDEGPGGLAGRRSVSGVTRLDWGAKGVCGHGHPIWRKIRPLPGIKPDLKASGLPRGSRVVRGGGAGPLAGGHLEEGGGAGGGAYQQVLLLELGDLVLALLLLFLDGLLDTPHEGVKLRLPLLLLLQAELEDVLADDDELVLVGEWPLRKLTAAWGGAHGVEAAPVAELQLGFGV